MLSKFKTLKKLSPAVSKAFFFEGGDGGGAGGGGGA